MRAEQVGSALQRAGPCPPQGHHAGASPASTPHRKCFTRGQKRGDSPRLRRGPSEEGRGNRGSQQHSRIEGGTKGQVSELAGRRAAALQDVAGGKRSLFAHGERLPPAPESTAEPRPAVARLLTLTADKTFMGARLFVTDVTAPR